MTEQKNPFDELYELVGESKTFEEQVTRIEALLKAGKIDNELNAVLLANSLYIPSLSVRNAQLIAAVEELSAQLKGNVVDEETPRNNLIPFPKKPIVN